MARIKLPEPLRAWKVITQLNDENDNQVFKISKKDADGSKTTAKLTFFELADDVYNQDNVDYIKDETEFVKSIISLGDFSNYIDIYAEDKPEKNILNLYIITQDLAPLSSVMETKKFSDNDIVDFGLQISEILEKLSKNNILHGNIKPSNIFVTDDGKYKLGGFIDAESAVNDLTYIAPEIHREEKADFTTDIYSLGLIMYSMCNSNKLPFESGSVSKDEAINIRLEGNAIPAPSNGNGKLKSVIVIACQNENKNRWKNAGNIRNALASIKAELPDNDVKPSPAQVIAPESTDFDNNVFEEYSFEEPESTANDNADANKTENTSESADNALNESEKIPAVVSNDTDKSYYDEVKTESENSQNDSAEKIKTSDDNSEIDNRVFDSYKNQKRILSINNSEKVSDKDYGDFFDDDESGTEKTSESEILNSQKSDYDINPFYTDNNEDDNVENSRSRKGLIAAIISGAVVLIALLGVLGVVAYNNGFFGGKTDTKNNNPTEDSKQTETTSAAETKQAATSSPETTQASSTIQDSTEAESLVVTGVVGYGYDYAREVLEAEGYIVEEGAYRYSNEYDEGYVIAQTPGEGQIAKKGSTIILDISIGPEPTEKPTENEQSSQNSQGGSGAVSSYKNNTSYLSQAEVSAMSRSELNLALNEIYARRGRIFKDPELDAYFRSQSWYTPLYTSEEFSQKVVFNDYEQKNINLIINEQTSRGYR